MDSLDKIDNINQSLSKRFGNNSPFQIITRLVEEVGELAQQVNHFEKTGVKERKMGTPDKYLLAKEAQDVIRCAMQIIHHYKAEDELSRSIDKDYEKYK